MGCFLLRVAVGLLGLAAFGSAQAGPALEPGLFGASASLVRAAVPEAQPRRAPLAGPGGSQGLYDLPPLRIAGHAFAGVLYFKKAALSRYERTWTSDAGTCQASAVFAAVARQLQQELGPGLLADGLAPDRAESSAHWDWGASAINLYQIQQATRCEVRLAQIPRVVVDNADTL